MSCAPLEASEDPAGSTGGWTLKLFAAAAFAACLSPWAAHGDLFSIAWVAHHALDGRVNLYQAVIDGPARELIGTLTYPPLTYLYFAAVMAIGRPFGLFAHAEWTFPVQLTRAECISLRLSFLPFLFLIGWTAHRLTREFVLPGDGANARRTFLLGMTSPVLLFVAFVFGQFDLIPAAMLFLGVYLLASRRVFWGIMAVFCGVWLKNFPALFLLIASPLLVAEYGIRRVISPVALGIAATWGLLRAFAGPGLSASYLAFSHHEYDVVFSYAGGWMDVRATLSNVLLLGLMLASVGLAAFRNGMKLWERLLLVYVLSLIFLLAPRYWMPQYMAWCAPGLVLLPALLLRLESPLVPLLYLGWNGAYLASTFILHPNNVDSLMFRWLYHPGVPPLAARLHLSGLRSEVWTAMFVLSLLIATAIAIRLCARDWLHARFRPVSPLPGPAQLWWATSGSVVLTAGFMAVHVLNILLARPHH
ncbi:MAG TPA: hypothetical protein VFE30_03450 [Anaeromyxobacteraceae bacterium]|jgi:hypothetical protein|nr:hypothetical protein [Anaeromyxobacteraceae bacterium]